MSSPHKGHLSSRELTALESLRADGIQGPLPALENGGISLITQYDIPSHSWNRLRLAVCLYILQGVSANDEQYSNDEMMKPYIYS